MSDQSTTPSGSDAEPRVLGDDVADDPFVVLADWLPANDDPRRPLVQLATADPDGSPHIRSLLLSSWDTSGFCFHTDANSSKCDQLADNTRAALVLVQPEQAHQLVVEGTVTPQDEREATASYRSRGDYLKKLAWLNGAELAVAAEAERLAAFGRLGADDVAEPPPWWVGYRLTPTRIVLWAGSATLPSRRISYERSEGATWRRRFLPG